MMYRGAYTDDMNLAHTSQSILADTIALRESVEQGPVVLGLTLTPIALCLRGGLFAPHLHTLTQGWSREELALTIDVRDEGAYSRELASVTPAALVTAITETFREWPLDWTDPLAFAYQRVAQPDSGQTYCIACDLPMQADSERANCTHHEHTCLACCACADLAEFTDLAVLATI